MIEQYLRDNLDVEFFSNHENTTVFTDNKISLWTYLENQSLDNLRLFKVYKNSDINDNYFKYRTILGIFKDNFDKNICSKEYSNGLSEDELWRYWNTSGWLIFNSLNDEKIYNVFKTFKNMKYSNFNDQSIKKIFNLNENYELYDYKFFYELFDWKKYINTYTDLCNLKEFDNKDKCWNHFETRGIGESRKIFNQCLHNHYINLLDSGKKILQKNEFLKTNTIICNEIFYKSRFKEDEYLKLNPNLKNLSDINLWEHARTIGFKEKKQIFKSKSLSNDYINFKNIELNFIKRFSRKKYFQLHPELVKKHDEYNLWDYVVTMFKNEGLPIFEDELINLSYLKFCNGLTYISDNENFNVYKLSLGNNDIFSLIYTYFDYDESIPYCDKCIHLISILDEIRLVNDKIGLIKLFYEKKNYKVYVYNRNDDVRTLKYKVNKVYLCNYLNYSNLKSIVPHCSKSNKSDITIIKADNLDSNVLSLIKKYFKKIFVLNTEIKNKLSRQINIPIEIIM